MYRWWSDKGSFGRELSHKIMRWLIGYLWPRKKKANKAKKNESHDIKTLSIMICTLSDALVTLSIELPSMTAIKDN